MSGFPWLVFPRSRNRTRSDDAAASFMYSTILSHRASLLSAPTLNPINCSGVCSDGPAAVRPADRSSQAATHTPARVVSSFERRTTHSYYRFEQHGSHGRDTIRHPDGPGPG